MIGAILRAYKDEHGLTVRQLAEELEEHYSTVSLWINGKRQPNIRQIRKIRNVTQVPYEQLLGESSSSQPS
jgi:transcriptional regulator with XRE-family HTH domain